MWIVLLWSVLRIYRLIKKLRLKLSAALLKPRLRVSGKRFYYNDNKSNVPKLEPYSF